ncbi:hypothetical protein [Streptomyces otsuchiensis]|uniref:hypothetical protein n=1 Tax=Streptomyces otsuchiensis TaxID=2681388 RepID=UPI00102FE51A|nr:hypothetical protein [Streptomyces otsuchiensis]
MTEQNEQPTKDDVAEAAKNVEVAAHAMAGAVLELQRLAPDQQATTAFGAQSSGSCGVTSCLFDPV